MKTNKSIELFVLSGFFGAGKTTLLHHMLTQNPEKKIGVIVNEFGAFHIDEFLIQRDNIRVDELNHGSVFCNCLIEYFKESIISFSYTDIDYLIVEASGMADPINMNLILYGIKDYCERNIRYKGSICLINGAEFEKDVHAFEIVKRQMKCSNFIVVNKADKLTRQQKKTIEEMIQEVVSDVKIFFTEYGKIPFDIIEKYLSANSYFGQTLNTREVAPEVYSLDADGVQELNKVLEFINQVKKYAIRIKGFITTNRQVYYIEGIKGDIILKESDMETKENTRIVLIGYDSTDFYDLTRELWERFVGTDYCLYD